MRLDNTNYWEENYRSRQTEPDAYDGWLDGYALLPGAEVLDLGCGAGTDLEKLLGCGAVVTAADFSESAVAIVKERFGGRVSAGCFDMREGFPYPGERFDAVVSDLSLHYFSWEDTERIVAELFRILKRGGRLIARVHSIKNLPADAERIDYGYYRAYGYDRRYFTETDIRRLFAGWEMRGICEKVASRYGGYKRVIEFEAKKAE